MRLVRFGVAILFGISSWALTESIDAQTPEAGHTAEAETSIVPLPNGRTAIDLLGTGQPGEIVVARRENGNAHGFSTVMFLVRGISDGVDRLQVLPFFGGEDDEESGSELMRTREGADCTLRDFRVLRRPGRPVEIVVATRAFGGSFATPAFVRFEFYILRQNSEAAPGRPTYYFERNRIVRAKRKFCDVNDAFEQELHLGTAGVLTWDGPR